MSLFSHSVTPTSLQPHDCSTPSVTISQNLLKHMSTELVMPSNHPVLYRPLLLLPSIFPSIRVFSNESALCIRWPKYWSFSFNISPSNIYSGLISFRTDNFDLAVQGSLQHHSWKALILWHSAFVMVQLSHPYMTTGITIWLFLYQYRYSNWEEVCRHSCGNVTLLWHPSTWSVDFSNGRPVRVLVNSNSESCVKWAMYRSYTVLPHMGFPGGSDGRVRLQCRRPAFDPWVGKIPWRRT